MRIGIDIDDTLTDIKAIMISNERNSNNEIKTFYNWKEIYNYINEME